MQLPKIKMDQIITVLRKHWLLVILIIIGSFLRFYNLRSTLMFLGDQGRDAMIVRDLLTKADPILIGPTTSVGKIQLGPFYYYFMAPFLLISNFDPIGPAIGVVLLGIATIVIFYFVLKEMFGLRVALIALSLYTFLNIVIVNTRFSWNPNPMPLFTILLIWSMYKVYSQNKYQFLPIVALFYGICLQLHYMVLLLAPMLVLFILLILINNKQNYRLVWQNLFKAVGVFLLLLLPLIIFDLRHNFMNLNGFLEFFEKGHNSPSNIMKIISNIKFSLENIFIKVLALDKLEQFKIYLAQVLAILFTLLCYAKKKSKEIQLIFLYFFSSFIGLSLYTGEIFDHYIGFIYPLTTIIIALLLETLINKIKLGKYFAVLIVLLLIWINIKTYTFYIPLGWGLDDTIKVSQFIEKDINGDTFNIVLLDETRDYRAMQYRYFLDKTNIHKYQDFNNISYLYLISQWNYQNIKTIETRELENYFGVNLNNMDESANKDFLATKIVQEWKFDDGLYVYKLQK